MKFISLTTVETKHFENHLLRSGHSLINLLLLLYVYKLLFGTAKYEDSIEFIAFGASIIFTSSQSSYLT